MVHNGDSGLIMSFELYNSCSVELYRNGIIYFHHCFQEVSSSHKHSTMVVRHPTVMSSHQKTSVRPQSQIRLQNHVCCLFTNHYGRSIGVTRCQMRHNGVVYHSQPFYSLHPTSGMLQWALTGTDGAAKMSGSLPKLRVYHCTPVSHGTHLTRASRVVCVLSHVFYILVQVLIRERCEIWGYAISSCILVINSVAVVLLHGLRSHEVQNISQP